jgi:YesN/AraC family two-component response regulator
MPQILGLDLIKKIREKDLNSNIKTIIVSAYVKNELLKGFKDDAFNDPVLALDNYQTNFYDLIILDINMPKMDGFELYTKLRQLDHKVNNLFFKCK